MKRLKVLLILLSSSLLSSCMTSSKALKEFETIIYTDYDRLSNLNYAPCDGCAENSKEYIYVTDLYLPKNRSFRKGDVLYMLISKGKVVSDNKKLDLTINYAKIIDVKIKLENPNSETHTLSISEFKRCKGDEQFHTNTDHINHFSMPSIIDILDSTTNQNGATKKVVKAQSYNIEKTEKWVTFTDSE